MAKGFFLATLADANALVKTYDPQTGAYQTTTLETAAWFTPSASAAEAAKNFINSLHPVSESVQTKAGDQ